MSEEGFQNPAMQPSKLDEDVQSEMDEEESQNPATQPSKLDDGVQFIGDRNAILFSAEAGEPLPPLDLPDDFFQLNKDDVRVLFKELKENREMMENAQFRTKAVREMEESMAMLQRLNRYTKTVLRIQFPDRLVLQAVFNHSDSVQIVMDFLKQFLDPPDVQFQLYTAPPKSVLKLESTMVEAKLTPRALVYFGPVPLGDQTTFLKSSLLTRLTSPKLASEAALHYRGRGNAKGDLDKCLKEARVSAVADKMSVQQASTSTFSRKCQKVRSNKKQNLRKETSLQEESHTSDHRETLYSGGNDHNLYDLVKNVKRSGRIKDKTNSCPETKLETKSRKATPKSVTDKKSIIPLAKSKITHFKSIRNNQNNSKAIQTRSKTLGQSEQKSIIKITGDCSLSVRSGYNLIGNITLAEKNIRKVIRSKTKVEVIKTNKKKNKAKSEIKRVGKPTREILEEIKRKTDTKIKVATKRKSNTSVRTASKKFKLSIPSKTKVSKSKKKHNIQQQNKRNQLNPR